MVYRPTDQAYDLAFADATDSTIAEVLGLTAAEMIAQRKKNRKLDMAIHKGRMFGESYAERDFGGSYNPGEGVGASQYASRPAPSGFRWDFVTARGSRVTRANVPVVALVRAA